MAAPPAPVRPLSSYLAKRCPRRVQLDLVEPGVPLEPTADVQSDDRDRAMSRFVS